jgi:hypothetical protein
MGDTRERSDKCFEPSNDLRAEAAMSGTSQAATGSAATKRTHESAAIAVMRRCMPLLAVAGSASSDRSDQASGWALLLRRSVCFWGIGDLYLRKMRRLLVVAVVGSICVAGLPAAAARLPVGAAGALSHAVALPAGLAPVLARALRQGPGVAPLTSSQQAELTAADGARDDLLGASVALSGSTAVVGAWGKASKTGAAYVFVRNGTTWTQQAKLSVADSTPGDEFGASVALSRNTALIGADGRNNYRGAGYVFVRSGTTWSQQAELAAADGIKGDYFGVSVALSGSTAVVGAYYGKTTKTGAAYVFVHSGTNWSQQAELAAAGGETDDFFGYSVALSANTALIGTIGKNDLTGAAYVFVRRGTSWSQQAELAAADGIKGDYFGVSVALSGSTALIGADNRNSRTGAAYVLVRRGTTWSQQAELTAASR